MRGRRQHRVNKENGGGVVPIVPVGVHLHGVAPWRLLGVPSRSTLVLIVGSFRLSCQYAARVMCVTLMLTVTRDS